MVASKETAAQRKARIRARLAQAETKQEDVTRNVTEPPNYERMEARDKASPEYEPPVPTEEPSSPPSRKRRNIPAPNARSIAQRAIERRGSKPANYKVHVVTALALTLTIRILALGPKIAFGGGK